MRELRWLMTQVEILKKREVLGRHDVPMDDIELLLKAQMYPNLTKLELLDVEDLLILEVMAKLMSKGVLIS